MEVPSHGGEIGDDQEPSTFNGRLKSFHYEATSTEPSRANVSVSSNPRVLRPRASGRITKTASASQPSPSRSRPSSASPSPTKVRRRKPSGYAPPSKYAHLKPLQDKMAPDLICLFVGVNPGVRTAEAGHAYAHPSNLFWKLLYRSGCTPRLCAPSEDVELPRLFGLGNTNIVGRPTRDASELSRQEMADGTPILENKIRQYRPEAVCLVGKGIWEAIWRHRYGRNPRKDEFRYGWQGETEYLGRTADWPGAKTFVATSTSGLSASTRPAEKEAIWRPLGEFVEKRREERTIGAQ